MLTSSKPNKCAHCKVRFAPEQARHKLHDACIAPWLEVQNAKKAAKAKKEQAARWRVEKAMDRKRADAIKTIADLIEEAQQAFNAFIRARDHGKPCICCGKPMERDAWGNPKVNAGHWRSRGAAGHLRFDEANCHSQRTSCNRPGGARPGPFREGMIARVGLAEVERLEASNEVEKWDRDVLKQIKTIYRAKLRDLKKEQE